MLSALALTLTFTACSSDDDPVVVEESKALLVDTDTLEMDVSATATFNITDGGGTYKVFSENTDVITADIDNNTVTVTSLKKGKTGVVISDAQGNYKRVIVQSMYMTMALDKDVVNIGMKLGHTDGSATVKVTAGNGGYTVVVDDALIAEASVHNDEIVITAKKEGSTKMTVTDMMGLTKTLDVKVTETDIPYTDEEKQEIVSTIDYDMTEWDGNTGDQWGEYSVQKSGEDHVVTWDYYGSYYIRFNIGADLSEGIKQNCKVTLKTDWWGPEKSYDNVTVEILKNNGSRIWGIAYVVKNNYLHLGKFCVEL